ncbi:MAG: PEP-utilizing enzyme [Patescibacteria group bacterium]|jgi:phosphohistidine swiveling domain-containing protein
MKNIQSIERRIFGRTKRWVIQGGILTPFATIIPAQAVTYELKKILPAFAASKVIVVCEKNGDRAYWAFDEDEFTQLGRKCLAHPRVIKDGYRRWKSDARKFYDCIHGLEKNGIRNIEKDFTRFYRLYLREYSLPLMTEYISLAGDECIRALFVKYGWSQKLEEDIVAFTRPPRRGFLQEVDLIVSRVAFRLGKKKLPPTFASFARQYPIEAKELITLQRKYFWIHFNYRDTVPLTSEFFYRSLKQLVTQSPEQLSERLNKLNRYPQLYAQDIQRTRRTTRLTGREQGQLQLIGFSAHWQDQRKAANLVANYWCNHFLSLVAKKSKVSLMDMKHLITPELFAYVKGTPIPKSELHKRIPGSFYAVFSKGDEYIFSGVAYKKMWKKIYEHNHPGEIKELKGIGASPGRYRGIVRRIENPIRDGKRLRQGDILLTYMTRPDFVPLMKYAGAIVTDEGGLTSHAAILAREMGIPCVVGTRFAMRTFTDGDQVEVDATDGVVRRLS